MNQLATATDRLPMDTVGMANGATGAKIAPQNLAEVVKFAEVMCRADIALPKHLRGNAGACMAVALQALEWQLSPFAVASKSYTVNGAIAYEAQLIAAVVNTRSGIKGRLKYRYEGEGPSMTCTVTGTLDDEECVYTTPTIGSITTKNSPLWKSDPQQQLGYFAARSWARRHCPEVILGVYDRDEAEQFRGPDAAKDVTPSVMDRLRNSSATQQVAGEREGFSRSFVADQTDEPHDPDTGELPTIPDTDEVPPASSEDVSASAGAPSEPEAESSAISGSTLYPTDRADLIECAVATLQLAHLKYGSDKERDLAFSQSKAAWQKKLPADLHKHIDSVFVVAVPVATKARTVDQAREWLSEALECTVEELGG